MASDTDLARAISEGEDLRWPIVRAQVKVPLWIQRRTDGETIDWQPSRILAFSEGGEVLSRLNKDSRNSESATLSGNQNADLWNWYLDHARAGYEKWMVAHPSYLPQESKIECGQVIRYGAGQYFTTHSDFSFYPKAGLHRVLLCLLGISSAQDYGGGAIHFETCAARFKLGRGDMLIYPAALLHEVEEITFGTRVTMLAEVCAPLSQLELQRYVDQFQHEPLRD